MAKEKWAKAVAETEAKAEVEAARGCGEVLRGWLCLCLAGG